MSDLILLYHGNDEPIRCANLNDAKDKAKKIALENTKENIYVKTIPEKAGLVTTYTFHDNALWRHVPSRTIT